MNKALKYGNRKEESTYWDASTPEKEAAALQLLFKHLDEDLRCYCMDVSDLESSLKDLKDLELSLLNGKIPKLIEEETKLKLKQIPEYERLISKAHYEKGLYTRAKYGDVKAIRSLLRSRQYYDYEEWELVDVIDPLGN